MPEFDRQEQYFGPWVMFLAVQARTEDCGWARQPADDAIDEAIAAIEDFIFANTPITRPMLEDVKRSAAAGRGSSSQQYCEDRNNALQQIRSLGPDRIREEVKEALADAKPRR